MLATNQMLWIKWSKQKVTVTKYFIYSIFFNIMNIKLIYNNYNTLSGWLMNDKKLKDINETRIFIRNQQYLQEYLQDSA